jgi:hypothetical protein
MRTLNLFLLFFFLFALNSYSLPKCNPNNENWNNCYGTFTSDGQRYEGGFKNNKMHGQGTYIFADGEKYVGEWKDGLNHGQGTTTLANGNKYEGEYKNNKRNGQGTYTYSDGRKYEGEWKDGKQHGQGTYTFTDGVKWVGPWVEDEFKGEKVGEKLGEECEGDDVTKWNNCWGNITFSDGAKYVGELKDGKMHGQGTNTYTWANGRKYIGEFKDDKQHGQGSTFYTKGSKKYEGEWRNGKMHGQGTYNFKNGNKYIGEFENNKRHGKGTLTLANGVKWVGPWVEDEFKGEKVGEVSSGTMEGLSDAYLMYNLYDQYCGEYVSSSKLKKAVKRFIKISLDMERKNGVKFNEEGAKDMAFQQALNNAKKEDYIMNFQLRLGYTAAISKKGESAGCAELRALQVNQINELSRIFEQTVKAKEEFKKERKRDF